MTTLAIIVYGAAIIFAVAYAMDVRATVNHLNNVVVELDRDLAVVETRLDERAPWSVCDFPDEGGFEDFEAEFGGSYED